MWISTKSLTMGIAVEERKDRVNFAPDGKQNLMATAPGVPAAGVGGILFLCDEGRGAKRRAKSRFDEQTCG